MFWPPGIARAALFPTPSRRVAPPWSARGLTAVRSAERCPDATTYVPEAVVAGPKGAIVTVAPVSSVTRRFPAASVTGSVKFTVTPIDWPAT